MEQKIQKIQGFISNTKIQIEELQFLLETAKIILAELEKQQDSQ